MKINISKATFSSIVGIGQKVKRAAKETGQEYLELNRGVNAVTTIDLSEIINQIDFNSKELQVYPPNLGLESLRNSIINEYFPSQIKEENSLSKIAITPGGMPALDLIMQILNVENIYFPKFYWGSYSKIATIRQKQFTFYSNILEFNTNKITENSCIFICDPNNPTGIKLDDNTLLQKIKALNETGAIIIFDCPYRKLFFNDTFFDEISKLENVIITESFSKWIGLSGLRLGFIWSNNKDFNDELNIRLLYEFNGVSSVSQHIVNKVMSTEEGKKASKQFRKETVKHIKVNINYLKESQLLSESIYQGAVPLGIFASINKSELELFNNRIGAVGMDKFIYHDKDEWTSHSRICVSVDSTKFKNYFQNINI